jgi:hypothetical protein
MQLLGQLDSIFPTYLLQRGNGNTELIYLGDAFLKNQVMDSRLTADEKNIMASGYSLNDMGGLLLFLNDNVFFATEWDDKPIVGAEVLEALRPKGKAEVKVKEKTEVGTAGRTETRTEISAADRTEEKAEVSAADRTKAKTEVSAADRMDTKTEVRAEEKTEIIAEEASEVRLTLEEELAIPKYKLPRGYKIIERMQKPEIFTVKEEHPASELQEVLQTSKHQEISDTSKLQEILETSELQEVLEISKLQEVLEAFTAEGVPAADVVKDSLEEQSDTADYEDANQGEKPDPKVALDIFEKYPRIYPFEDNDILICVKIEPKDIGLLPKDLWVLSNNSFLVHGYYCYHHLIFAKLKDRYGSRFILGVPGIYHDRERFMARMFGFDSFKPIRRRELRQGDFGYWYMTVTF